MAGFLDKPELIEVREDRFKVPYQGVVVDNDDPKKLKRVKCTVKGLFDDIPQEKLPWILPESATFLGGSSEAGMFSIPNVNAKLKIVFPYDDVYMPFYSGHWDSEPNKIELFMEDYPNSYGFKDELDNYFKVNRKEERMDIFHSSGTKVQIFKDGNIEILGVDDANIVINGKCTETIHKDFTTYAKENRIQTIDKDYTTQVLQNIIFQAMQAGNYHATGSNSFTSSSLVNISAPAVNITASGGDTVGYMRGIWNHLGQYNHEGNTAQWGTHFILGDLVVNGISFMNHVHGGIDRGSSSTDPPS